jgi:hypothetical protein
VGKKGTNQQRKKNRMIFIRNSITLCKFFFLNWLGFRYTYRLKIDLTKEMEQLIEEEEEKANPRFCSCSFCVFVQNYFQWLVYPLAFLMVPLKVEKNT